MSRTGSRRLFNVPTELSSFVGRREELAELRGLLARGRLVTLVGTGGVGKTRLALRGAAMLQRAFPDGIWLVELASLGDPTLVGQEVGTALGFRDRSLRWSDGSIAQFVGQKHMLLVLDNCEHLLSACAVLVIALLRACPKLQVLATSRQALGVPGETSWRVPSLSLPESEALAGPADAMRYEAVRLLVDRATSLRQDFAVTSENYRPVVQLCERLDGIPLAIELAAGRLQALSVEQLVLRLDHRLELLTGGTRTQTPRHQTLRAALDWSHELLEEEERLLWHRLSVFAGSFDLEAAEAVCADGLLLAERVLGVIASLVEKSVLTPEHRGAEIRYRLLESLREYGLERLIASGEDLSLRRRQRDWCARMCADAARHYGDVRQLEAFSRLEIEHANLRSALQFCATQPGEAEVGLAIAADLWLFWEARYHVSEGRDWFKRLLGIAIAPSLHRARALWAAGYLALLQSDVTDALPMLHESRRLAEPQGDAETLGYALQYLGFAALFRGALAESVSLVEEALALHRTTGDHAPAAGALLHLGLVHSFQGDLDEAARLYGESLAISEAEGDRWIRSYSLFGLGLVIWLQGHDRRAVSVLNESLRLKQVIDDRSGIALCLEALGWIAAGDGHAERAAKLLGAARTIWDALLISIYDPWKVYHDSAEARARKRLGELGFEVAFRRGREMAISHAASYALQEPTVGHSRESPVESRGIRLTERESQVVALIAQGLSDKDIGAALVVSRRTAESHVRHILDKLGFNSRAQIAAWVGDKAIPASR